MANEEDDPFAALAALFSNGPRVPHRRRYVLEHIDGEWVFVREKCDLMFDEIIDGLFGPDPEVDPDRKYVLKLP
jgi:hypothetical protein